MSATTTARVEEVFGSATAAGNPGFVGAHCPACGCCRICVSEIDPELRRTIKATGQHKSGVTGAVYGGCTRCGTPLSRAAACRKSRGLELRRCLSCDREYAAPEDHGRPHGNGCPHCGASLGTSERAGEQEVTA